MKNIRPITDLRKTNEISDQAHLDNKPIFITKNGYSDLVVMSQEYYDSITCDEVFDSVKEESFIQASKQSENMGFVKVSFQN